MNDTPLRCPVCSEPISEHATPKALAHRMGVSVRTILRWIACCSLDSTQVGARHRVCPRSIARILRQNRKDSAA